MVMAFESLKQDLVYAIRGLRARPGFALAVIATLGLAIGANAAMFGIVRLARSFSSVSGYTSRDLAVGVGDAAREMRIGVVSASFFGFFDALPALGRYFSEAEDQPPSGVPVAVLSHSMWQTQYGGCRDVLGSTLQIGPTVYTIIGVSSPGFVGLWADRQTGCDGRAGQRRSHERVPEEPRGRAHRAASRAPAQYSSSPRGGRLYHVRARPQRFERRKGCDVGRRGPQRGAANGVGAPGPMTRPAPASIDQETFRVFRRRKSIRMN